MFGYVITNCSTLTDEQRQRFRAMYCGMCKVLRKRFGNIERCTLSYDMTFLAMVLSALYEGEEEQGTEKCAMHPLKAHDYISNAFMEYAVDLNVMLAYHKCMDNKQDDKSLVGTVGAALLKKAYERAKAIRPEQESAIMRWMELVNTVEKSGSQEIDPLVNATGEMMGKLFCMRNDCWSEDLMKMGSGLGKFIYLMDAYEDLQEDIKHNRYNPLRSFMNQSDYEEFCKSAMTMMMSECADGFEMLPIIRDGDLIRNIIYSGVWVKYNTLQARKQKQGIKEQKNAGSL